MPKSPATPPKSEKTPPGPAKPTAFDKAFEELRQNPGAFPNISPRWLAGAAAAAILAALVCAWLTLCLLYWQGSWQFLYHPSAAITRTPASIGIAYEPIQFAVTETGTPRLTGWWIPHPDAKFTILLLHGADGNLSETLDTIAALHRQRLSVFAIDYRGYGQSIPAKPSEKLLRQDAEWALSWLTVTRNLPAQTVLVYGIGIGANLAAELAAEPASIHSKLAGIILDQPSGQPMAPVFNDPRSHIVPARWLVQDRYDLNAAAARLGITSLWLFAEPDRKQSNPSAGILSSAYESVQSQKSSVWLKPPIATDPHVAETLRRWVDALP